MHPNLIELGGTRILSTYGLLVAIAFLVGMQLSAREARRVDLGKHPDGRPFDGFILDLSLWILVASIVGARVYYIAVNWAGEYSRDPLKIFRLWEGGLVFYGGFIASLIVAPLYCKKRGFDFFHAADILVPQLALGIFLGRLGCFFAGCCWGATVDADFPLAVQFPAESLIHSSQVRRGLISPTDAWTLHVHPVQLYDSAAGLVYFFFLHWLRTHKRVHGQLILTFLVLYAAHRAAIETLRGDVERGVYRIFGNVSLSVAQITSIAVALAAVAVFVVLVRRSKTAARVGGSDSGKPHSIVVQTKN